MLVKHVYDREFTYASKPLKTVLAFLKQKELRKSLDVPCGNGRNIFLLATYFKETVGIDAKPSLLQAIESNVSKYENIGAIKTKVIDVLYDEIPEMNEYDFICNVHFYKFSVCSNLIQRMKRGTYLYIETPSCHGGNFKELPSLQEIGSLTYELEILMLNKRICSKLDVAERFSFNALLRKN